MLMLYGCCENCSKKNSFLSVCESRVDFFENNGKHKTITCKYCSHENIIHINNLTAKSSLFSIVIRIGVLLIGTIWFGYFLYQFNGALSDVLHRIAFYMHLVIPLIVFTLLNRNEENKIRSFNSYKIKD
jgi:hypothetical protein